MSISLEVWALVIAILSGVIVPAVLALFKREEERRQADRRAAREAEALYVQGDAKRKRAENLSPLASLNESSRDDLLWDAVELLCQAAAKYPSQAKKAPAYLSLGKCYEDLKLEDHALKAFSNAIICDGNLTEAFERRGFAYLGVGDYMAACNDLDVVLQREDSEDLETVKVAWNSNCKHRWTGPSRQRLVSRRKTRFVEVFRKVYSKVRERRQE